MSYKDEGIGRVEDYVTFEWFEAKCKREGFSNGGYIGLLAGAIVGLLIARCSAWVAGWMA